jgi:hypothetical protein
MEAPLMRSLHYASLGAFLILFATNAKAQEVQQTIFCDRQDEIVAIVNYGEAAIAIINRKLPQACGEFNARFLRGDIVETVKVDGKLWDITPVMILSVGTRVVTPTPQWAAFKSLLVEARR